MTPVLLERARAIMLHTQRLTRPPTDIKALLDQIGALQIDTIHKVARSHHLVLWSRFGTYDRADLARLTYGEDPRLFEYWKKAACYIPLEEYRYRIPRMRRTRAAPSARWRRWLDDADNQRVLADVRERITQEGGQRAADFKQQKREPGGWWNWKPAKMALEYLFAIGEVLVADRVNFQRVYDLTERVLPDWVDTSEPTAEEALRFTIEQAGRALGICEPHHTIDYAYTTRTRGRPIVQALLDEGVFVAVTGETLTGPVPMIMHRDNLPLIETAPQPNRTTFLSFFDSLLWAKGRDETMWGFKNVLEAYKPAKDRIWGYFCLSILHNGRFVGRFDPTLDRKAGRLVIHNLYLENEPLSDGLVEGVAAALRDFLVFHRAAEVVIERSDPPAFSEQLLTRTAR
ncbi:MAG: winged helix-turn-helix domain-containing protein [Chloroflexi bacterium]|nr:winged helix-turn-helix domain-containing protein [Chloroflexota bacterium]